MYERLKNIIEENSNPINVDLWKEIKSKAQLITLQKHSVLADYGSNQKYVYFIESGSLVVSTISKDGNEKAVWFHLDDIFYMATCVDSYFQDKATKYQIKALENSTVIRFSKQSFDTWVQNYPSFNQFYINRITEGSIERQELNALRLVSTPEQFLTILKERYPSLINRVSSKNIAHFLGISPEWYSKLKKRMGS